MASRGLAPEKGEEQRVRQPSNLTSSSMEIHPIAFFDIEDVPSSPQRAHSGSESVTPHRSTASTSRMGPPEIPPTLPKKSKKKRKQSDQSPASRRTLLETTGTLPIHYGNQSPTQTITVTQTERTGTGEVLRLRSSLPPSPQHRILPMGYASPFQTREYSPNERSYERQGYHLISSPIHHRPASLPYNSPQHQPVPMMFFTPAHSPSYSPAASPNYEGHFQSNPSLFNTQLYQQEVQQQLQREQGFQQMSSSFQQHSAPVPYASPQHQQRPIHFVSPTPSQMHSPAAGHNNDAYLNMLNYFPDSGQQQSYNQHQSYQNPNGQAQDQGGIANFENPQNLGLDTLDQNQTLLNATDQVRTQAHQFEPMSLDFHVPDNIDQFFEQQQHGQQQQQQQQWQQQQQGQQQQQFLQQNQSQQNESNLPPDQNLPDQVPGPSGEATDRNVAQRNVQMHEVTTYDDDIYEDLNNEELQDVQREFYASTTDTISNEEETEPVQGTSFDQGATNTKKDRGKALRVSEGKTLPTAKKSAPPTEETQKKSRTPQRKRKSRGENEEEEVQSDDSETSNMSRNSHTSRASSEARHKTMAQKKQDEQDQKDMDVAGNPDRCYPYLKIVNAKRRLRDGAICYKIDWSRTEAWHVDYELKESIPGSRLLAAARRFNCRR